MDIAAIILNRPSNACSALSDSNDPIIFTATAIIRTAAAIPNNVPFKPLICTPSLPIDADDLDSLSIAADNPTRTPIIIMADINSL